MCLARQCILIGRKHSSIQVERTCRCRPDIKVGILAVCFAGSSSHLNISFMFLQWRGQENEGQSPTASLCCVMFGICHFGICHVLYSCKFTYVSLLIGTWPRWPRLNCYLSHLPLLGIHLALSSGSVHKGLPSQIAHWVSFICLFWFCLKVWE